jgi:hypothetical protein
VATATFLTEKHIYQRDGIVVPSVTQVLALAGIDDVSGIPLHNLERAAAVGTAVHQACEFLDQDELDIESVGPLIVGYVLAYQRFKEEHEFFPLTIEQRGIAESGALAYGYCLDRTGIIEGTPVLLDIKTASKRSPAWAIQTAAYADAINLNSARRLVIHANKSGAYDLIPYTDAKDFDVWYSALHAAHWKLAHGWKIPR